MIKDSIREYEDVMQKFQARPSHHTGSFSTSSSSGEISPINRTAARSARYSTENGYAPVSPSTPVRKSAIARLMDTARGFAEHHDEPFRPDDEYESKCLIFNKNW